MTLTARGLATLPRVSKALVASQTLQVRYRVICSQRPSFSDVRSGSTSGLFEGRIIGAARRFTNVSCWDAATDAAPRKRKTLLLARRPEYRQEPRPDFILKPTSERFSLYAYGEKRSTSTTASAKACGAS